MTCLWVSWVQTACLAARVEFQSRLGGDQNISTLFWQKCANKQCFENYKSIVHNRLTLWLYVHTVHTVHTVYTVHNLCTLCILGEANKQCFENYRSIVHNRLTIWLYVHTVHCAQSMHTVHVCTRCAHCAYLVNPVQSVHTVTVYPVHTVRTVSTLCKFSAHCAHQMFRPRISGSERSLWVSFIALCMQLPPK